MTEPRVARSPWRAVGFLLALLLPIVVALVWLFWPADEIATVSAEPSAAPTVDAERPTAPRSDPSRASTSAAARPRRPRTSKDGRPLVLVMVIVKSDRTPVPGAELRTESNGVFAKAGDTGPDGVAPVILADGVTDAVLLVRKTGFKEERRELSPDDGDLIVELEPDVGTSTVSVRVTSPSPIGDEVRIRLSGTQPGAADPPVGPTAQFSAVRGGKQSVSVSGASVGAGWQITTDVEVQSGRDLSVDVPFDPTIRVTGRVVDVDGRPIADAYVSFQSQSLSPPIRRMSWTLSDRDGAFSLPGFAAQQGTVTAGDANSSDFRLPREARERLQRVQSAVAERLHIWATESGVLPGGDPLVITLHYPPRIVGRVSPAGARVGQLQFRSPQTITGNSSGPSGPWRHMGVSLAVDGAFDVALPAHDEPLDCVLCVDGLAPASLRLPAVALDTVRDVGEIVLVEGLDLDVPVVDADGAPCAFRHVDIFPSARLERGVATDEDGRLRLDNLAPGALRLSFPAWRSVPQTIVVIDDVASPPAKIVIGAGATVQGRVVGANARAGTIRRVSFRLIGLHGEIGESVHSTIDANGRFVVRAQAGRHRVRVDEGGKRIDVGDVEITLAEGEKQEIELRVR